MKLIYFISWVFFLNFLALCVWRVVAKKSKLQKITWNHNIQNSFFQIKKNIVRIKFREIINIKKTEKKVWHFGSLAILLSHRQKTYLINNISSLFGQKITKYFLPWKWNQLFKSQYQCNVGSRFFVRENIRYLFLSFFYKSSRKIIKKGPPVLFSSFWTT